MTLHVAVEVRDTDARGRGVFALVPIPAGTLIETAAVIPVSSDEVGVLQDCVLAEYYFRWGKDGREGAIALGYGSLYNHSFKPNARYVKHYERQTIDFVAIRDIAVGEEIRTNYNGESGDQTRLWFDASE
ncbi:MAG TPA: SET domain-containing protein [Gammaproteobacteria bacterium]|nr:SET domain-containing protein [Gammaproteobacteria bacterium]